MYTEKRGKNNISQSMHSRILTSPHSVSLASWAVIVVAFKLMTHRTSFTDSYARWKSQIFHMTQSQQQCRNLYFHLFKTLHPTPPPHLPQGEERLICPFLTTQMFSWGMAFFWRHLFFHGRILFCLVSFAQIGFLLKVCFNFSFWNCKSFYATVLNGLVWCRVAF
jgi:hypothetical protein